MTYQEYITLINKRFTGEISAEETALLKRLVNTSERNKKIYLQQKKLWLETNEPLPKKKSGTQTGSPHIEDSNNKPKNHTHSVAKSKRKKWYKFAIAASILILAGLSYYIMSAQTTSIKRFATLKDKKKQIVLPDNSHVRLNFDTKITYRQNELGQRLMSLNGEAFFEVNKSLKPFIIETQNAKITVLGTVFALTSRWGKTRLWVKRGKVRFKNLKHPDSSVVLSKNQFSESEGKKAPTKPVAISVDDLPGWVDGKIIFNQTSMKDVARQLEREFDIHILIVSRGIENMTVTGEFKREAVEKVLTALGGSFSFEYKLLNGSYIIFQSKSQKMKHLQNVGQSQTR